MGMAEPGTGRHIASSADISEENVIQRILAGETDLYGILANRYNRRLYQLVLRILRNEADAEDVVQQTHMRALTYLHQFAGRSKFITWLSQVAANEALRHVRQQRRRRELLYKTTAGYRAAVFVSAVRDPESSVWDGEIREVLRNALASLRPQYRAVFVLKELGDAATEEIASSMMITSRNVRLKLHRARRLLRKSMNHYQQSFDAERRPDLLPRTGGATLHPVSK